MSSRGSLSASSDADKRDSFLARSRPPLAFTPHPSSLQPAQQPLSDPRNPHCRCLASWDAARSTGRRRLRSRTLWHS